MDIFNSYYVHIGIGFLCALVLFLFAIDNLGKEIQELASERFREKISRIANNTYLGTLFGFFSSAVMQSSSAANILIILLVNTGILSFRNSLGLLFGSNIGTTITAQLVLINSATLSSLLIIAGFLFNIVGKKSKLIAKPIFFLGVILFSLSMLSSELEPLKSNPHVVDFFQHLSNPLLAYFVGTIFTLLVHSSAITTGIFVILANSGLIPIEVSVPLVLGANLGSSILVCYVSTKLNLFAKRVGFSDLLFNGIGTLLFLIFLTPYISFLTSLTESIGFQTALSHILFNVINTLIFLGFINPFEKLVIKIVKGSEEEILFRTRYLTKNFRKNIKSKEKILNIKKEITYSIENTIKIYRNAISSFYNPSDKIRMNIHKLETLNDYLDDEITKSILELSQYKLNSKSAHNLVTMIKVSNSIEQLGDLGLDLSQIFQRMYRFNISSKEINIERLTDIHNRLISLFRDIERNIVSTSESKLAKIKVKEEEIYGMIKEDFETHVQRLQKENGYDGNIFVDAISIIELSVSKVRDIRKSLLKQIKEM